MDEKELDKMAEDIEPIEETKEDVTETPKEEVKSEAPTGFVEDKETYVKPDGETSTTPVHNLIKEESGAKKWMLGGLASILILGLGAATAWLYMDAQSARNELQSVKTGLDTAKSDAAKLRDEVQTLKVAPKEPAEEPATTQELADNTVKAYKTAASGVNLFVRVEKLQGDSVSIYMKPQTPNAEPSLAILKKANGQLVQVKQINGPAVISQEDADLLKSVYGIDITKLGVTIE